MEAKFLAMARVLSFLSIFIAICVVRAEELLVPNYDNKELELKVYEIKYPLVLSCNVTQPTDQELQWTKNNVDVAKVEELTNRYEILKDEKKLIIKKSEANDAGNYACGVMGQTRNIEVVAKVTVRVPSNTGVVEGEKLTVHCAVLGTNASIHWEYGNETIKSGEKYVLIAENGVQNAILTLENVSLTDRGEYKCIGSNKATENDLAQLASDVTLVRVKGKLAALWPFLGICAEVLILCTIILIYEKRRNKAELEESDTDQNTEQ